MIRVLSFVVSLLFLGSTAMRMRSHGLHPNTDYIIGLASLASIACVFISMKTLKSDIHNRRRVKSLRQSPMFVFQHFLMPLIAIACNVAYVIRIFMSSSLIYRNIPSLSLLAMTASFLINAYIASLHFYSSFRSELTFKKV
jgi:hypothetical protein